MSWYLIALVLGIIAPWFVPGGPIGVAFEEGGLQKGISLATIPHDATPDVARTFLFLGEMLELP
jgi:hypothetical protein